MKKQILLKDYSGRRIICYENDEVYESVKHASEELQLSRYKITKALKEHTDADGLHFKYVNHNKNK